MTSYKSTYVLQVQPGLWKIVHKTELLPREFKVKSDADGSARDLIQGRKSVQQVIEEEK